MPMNSTSNATSRFSYKLKGVSNNAGHSFACTFQHHNLLHSKDSSFQSSFSLKMRFSILLELESKSCQAIHALRTANRQPAQFALSLTHQRLLYTPASKKLLLQVLPQIAAKQSPIAMSFCNLHKTNEKQDISVRYQLHSKELYILQDVIRRSLPTALVLDPANSGITMNHQGYWKYPGLWHSRIGVPVRNKIETAEEANRIFEELAKIDPVSLGNLVAVGFRLQWRP